MKKLSPRLMNGPLTAATLALLLSFSAVAADTLWTGEIDSDWSKAGNWSNGLPTSDTTYTPVISLDGAVVNMTSPVSTRNTIVSGKVVTAPVLNITSNFTNSFSAITVGSHVTGSGYSGIVNHTSGTLSIGGTSGSRRLFIAASAASDVQQDNSGTYNFGGTQGSAPTLDVGGAISVGRRMGETGVMTLSGYGTLLQGKLDQTEHFHLGQFNGNATLNVIGGDLDITLSNNLILLASGNGKATLNATLTASGFSTIHVGGAVQFSNNTGSNKTAFTLSLDGYTGAIGDVITIIDGGSAFTGFGAFGNVAHNQIISADGYEFMAIYDLVNHDFKLEVVAIPEPSTTAAVMLNLGIVGLAVRHYRR